MTVRFVPVYCGEKKTRGEGVAGVCVGSVWVGVWGGVWEETAPAVVMKTFFTDGAL